MAKLLKLRRGTTSQHSSFTGAEGEVTVDTDKETLVVHNGSSAAGFPLARESAITSKADLASPDFTTDITLKAQAPVKFEDDSGGEYVGLKAPTGVTSYTVTLPATAPSNGQVLKATSATALGWSADTALTLVDEDDFSSNSATAVPSQQSAKAYITATSQPLDADLTSLAGCQTGSAAALALLTSTEVEVLDGATVTTAELNILDGVTSTAAELNILDGVTSTAAELNKLDGFTGDKDDLIYAKDLKATGVTATEFDYLDGVTSAIQTQINAKGVGDAVLASDQSWSGSQRGTISDVGTKTANFDLDLNTANNFKITIGATFELGFTNITAGQSGTIEAVSNGAWTPTFGSEIHFVGGTVPSLTQSATSYLAYYCPTGSVVFVQHMLNVKQGGT